MGSILLPETASRSAGSSAALRPGWLDPKVVVHWSGPLAVLGVLALVFAETGLLAGFFLPGDSLMFTAGLLSATGFITRYGGRAIVLARFVPIVRTFAPVAAGMGQMRYRQFVAYDAFGALLWGAGVSLLGAWLGHLAVVRANIDLILLMAVAVSVAPIPVKVLRARVRRRRGEILGGVTAATLGSERPGSWDAPR